MYCVSHSHHIPLFGRQLTRSRIKCLQLLSRVPQLALLPVLAAELRRFLYGSDVAGKDSTQTVRALASGGSDEVGQWVQWSRSDGGGLPVQDWGNMSGWGCVLQPHQLCWPSPTQPLSNSTASAKDNSNSKVVVLTSDGSPWPWDLQYSRSSLSYFPSAAQSTLEQQGKTHQRTARIESLAEQKECWAALLWGHHAWLRLAALCTVWPADLDNTQRESAVGVLAHGLVARRLEREQGAQGDSKQGSSSSSLSSQSHCGKGATLTSLPKLPTVAGLSKRISMLAEHFAGAFVMRSFIVLPTALT